MDQVTPSARNTGIFKPFAQESQLRRARDSGDVVESGSGGSGEGEVQAHGSREYKGLGVYANVDLPYNNERTCKTSTAKPNLFQKRRAPTTPLLKKLTPSKPLGMFAAALPTPRTSSPGQDGNKLDMTMPGGFGNELDWANEIDTNNPFTGARPGDPSQDLATVEEGPNHSTDTSAANATSTSDPTVPAEVGEGQVMAGTETHPTAPAGPTATSEVNDAGHAAALQEPADESDAGYLADQNEMRDETPVTQPKRRGRPPKDATATPAKLQTESEDPGRTRSASAKQVEAAKAEKLANRLRKRNSLPTAPSRSSPRKQTVTARAATLQRRKPKKVVSPVANKGITKKPIVKGSRHSGRLASVVSWKGEKLDVQGGKGYVAVVVDGEDRSEYQKHY
ncbi:hypothetical protein LTR53_010506 [Teratosphaeriaceae sp. CCFEE 6253]|nr:hypothetical protein LTR53_010506 [Teratosphaeriaceae sp. CCFEE 6253]